ncbi:hypothetical protein KFE69_04970 [bacterium SCSIO 12844]|nr:hypothetical protein KFE69_04970 [bacterium SCSIO 12844]
MLGFIAENIRYYYEVTSQFFSMLFQERQNAAKINLQRINKPLNLLESKQKKLNRN